MLGAAPVVAWAFSQDGLTTDRAPIAARVDAGHEFGALLLLMAAVLLAAGLARPLRRRPAPADAAHAPARRPRGARRARALPVVGADRARDRAGRDRRPGLQGVGPAHRPQRQDAGQHARPADRDLVGARALLEARRSTSTPPRRGSAPAPARYATVRTRFRTDALAVRHAHGYVVQTLADLGWAGLAAVAARRGRLAGRRRARDRRAARRDRGLPYDAERVGMLTLVVVVRRLRRPLGRSTGRGSSPPTPASRCCARAGSPAAGRCAPGSSAPTGPPAPRRRRGRTPAGSRGSRAACRRCAASPPRS